MTAIKVIVRGVELVVPSNDRLFVRKTLSTRLHNRRSTEHFITELYFNLVLGHQLEISRVFLLAALQRRLRFLRSQERDGGSPSHWSDIPGSIERDIASTEMWVARLQTQVVDDRAVWHAAQQAHPQLIAA
jgi:hypothetical protein